MGVDDDVVAAAVAEAGFLAPFFLDAAMFWQSVWSLASTEAWSGPREAAAVAEAGFLDTHSSVCSALLCLSACTAALYSLLCLLKLCSESESEYAMLCSALLCLL